MTTRTAVTSTDPLAGPPTGGSQHRLLALDGARGLAIVIMLFAGNPLPRQHLPDQLSHPQWHGLTFADLFFPLFLFAMGVAMTMSRRTGSSWMVIRRVLLLVVIGIALTSHKHERLVAFGVLQHIAGAYLLAWLALKAPRRFQVFIAVGTLLSVWIAHLLFGNGDPWGQEGTFAHEVQRWLGSGFTPEGAVQTVTSTVTVLGGAFVGFGMRHRRDPAVLLRWVSAHSVWLIAAGALLALVIPINKRLWTPSFTVLTLGTSCAWFALLIWLADIRRRAWLVRPLEDLGANPIAIYVLFMTARSLLDDYRSWWPELAPFGNPAAGTLIYGLLWTIVAWAFARLLVNRDIYLKL